MNEELYKIDVERIVSHWITTSEEDYQTMISLFKSRSYAWALFIGHLSVEKLLKAYYVRLKKEHAPFTHNLYRLAELCDLYLTDEYSDWLDKITAFNLNARYDDYKREFYSLCTTEYAEYWIEKIEILRTWIKQKL